MSRIGRMPVKIPDKVNFELSDGNVIKVKGPKGEISRTFHPDMQITLKDNQIIVDRPSENKMHKALHGLTRTLIKNMIVGVTEGFEKKLELVGVGYRAVMQGKKLVLTVGHSYPVEIEPEDGLEIEAPAANKIVVKGIDKEKVGSLAADIRAVRPPEPYKGKGIRYEGEKIKRKVGKSGVKAT